MSQVELLCYCRRSPFTLIFVADHFASSFLFLFFFFFSCCCCPFFWLIATLRIFFIRAIKVQTYFCRMVENHFVMVLIVFKLSSVANCEASSCFGFWIQIILATLPIVLQLSQAYTCRSIESNFATGFKLVLPRQTT